MKLGKLGMVVGAAVGYVLGAKAGRERYDQITASARQLLEQPQVKKVVDSARATWGCAWSRWPTRRPTRSPRPATRWPPVGDRDQRHQRRDHDHHELGLDHQHHLTPSASSSTATTTAGGDTTETGTTTAKRAASERKPKSS